MTKEELIGKLQMVYVGDKNALDELIGYYDGLKTIIGELQQENKRLQDKLNKVSQEIDDILVFDDFSDTTRGIGNVKEELKFYLSDCETLDEFRKLENGDSNE